MATIEEVIKIAKGEVGYNRYTDPEQGTKYGRWYAKLTGSPYFGTTGVPFCAMGVSWVFNKANTRCLGLPTAGCTSGILTPARNSGKLLKPAALKRGDVILFDWSGRGYTAPEADHVGIVLYWNSSTNVHTWEANVSGMVKECDRDIKWVVGGVRPQYDEEEIVTDADIQKIAKAVWAYQIDYKNGADDSPHKASAAARLGYIDYESHPVIRKLDQIIKILTEK